MEPVCGDRPEGSRCERRCPGNRMRREAKASQRVQNRRHAGAERQPGTRAGSQGARRGSQEGVQPEPSGPGGTGPGLPIRHPRTRRTSRGFPRGGRRVQQPLQVEPMSQQSKPPAVRKQRELSLRSWWHQVRKADGRGNEAFTPVAAVSGARSLPGSHVPAQEGLPQGRGRYRGRRGGAGAPCRGAWEVGTDRSLCAGRSRNALAA